MKSGPTTTEPRLSSAARHVVLPDGIVSSGWPSVAKTLVNLGICFDVWQKDLGRVILAKRRNGKYAAGIGGVVMSIPRQVGKTFTVGAIVFALCLLFPGIRVIWTAHHSNTSDETFEAMQQMALMRKIKPHILRVTTGNGKQRIRFRNKSQIEFGAREHGFGRGKTKISILVLDEAQHVSESALENLVPTMNQGSNPLLFMMGTPPRPIDRGDAFKNRRSRALKGDSNNVLFVEFSADEDANLDDRKQWAKANPSYPKRTPEDAILRLREALGSDDSFKREALGIWDNDELGDHPIHASWWANTAIGFNDPLPGEGVPSYGVRFSADGSRVSLAGALSFGEGQPVFVETIETKSMLFGIDWLADWLEKRWRACSMIVVDGKSDAAALILELRRRKVSYRAINFGHDLLTSTAASDAYSAFTNAARSGPSALLHSNDEGQSVLDASVKGSVRRKIGNDGRFGFQPHHKDIESESVEAAALAFFAASTSKRKPAGEARKARGSLVM
ncbi:hypothetical protein [Timonella sp. A28]|uniref:hypothetical protein n=1 Tax=Timonella sp. A28 TaxID=3442640 RepID=UPI003EBB8DC3